MKDCDWYFHNISEDIIYGPISHENWWIDTTRKIKKVAIIRKLARDTKIDTDALPPALAKAVLKFRQTNTDIRGGSENESE